MAGTYGGYAPQPERYGGGKRRLEYILDALLHSCEKEIGLDTTVGGATWCEEMATARAIDQAWGTNTRAANEFDPRRTTSMLARWEAIFAITPLASDTPVSRRARLLFRFQALGKDPAPQQIVDDLTFLGGTAFIQIDNTTSTTGPSYYPGSPFANPYDYHGTTTAGVSLVDWWTNVLHLAVRVTQPTGMPTTTFNDRMSAINSYLDGALPAWCTWSIYQLAHSGAVGFFLDEANLGLEAFRT